MKEQTTLLCRSCGASQLALDARFCYRCGAPIAPARAHPSRSSIPVVVALVIAVVALLAAAVWLGRPIPGIIRGVLERRGTTTSRAEKVPTAVRTIQASAARPTPGVTANLASSTVAPKTATRPLSPSQTPNPSAGPLTRSQIEAGVIEAVERGQQAKESAYLANDASGLADAFSGQALGFQTQRVNDAVAQGCTWEMHLFAPMAYTWIELRGDDWVHVKVTKYETQRSRCRGTVTPETRDTYEVHFLVERLNGRWFVTCTDLVDPPSEPCFR